MKPRCETLTRVTHRMGVLITILIVTTGGTTVARGHGGGGHGGGGHGGGGHGGGGHMGGGHMGGGHFGGGMHMGGMTHMGGVSHLGGFARAGGYPHMGGMSGMGAYSHLGAVRASWGSNGRSGTCQQWNGSPWRDDGQSFRSDAAGCRPIRLDARTRQRWHQQYAHERTGPDRHRQPDTAPLEPRTLRTPRKGSTRWGTGLRATG